MLSYWVDSSLKKVFRDDVESSGKKEIALKLARNESEDAQIVVRSDRKIRRLAVKTDSFKGLKGAVIPANKVRYDFVGYVPVGFNTNNTEDDELVRKAPDLFPDPFLEERTISLEKDLTQSIWITVRVEEGMPAGEYNGKITVIADKQKIQVPVKVIVWDIILPKKQSLLITNWISEDSLVKQYKLKRFTPAYWKVLEMVAKNMAEHKQNIINPPMFVLIKTIKDGKKYRYDYTNFDKWIGIFDKYGVADLIEGTHICSRIGNGETQYGYDAQMVYLPTGQSIFLPKEAVPNKFMESFLGDFLRNLRDHLKEKGWLDRFVMHVADEPNIHNFKTFRIACDFVKSVIPDVRRIDAVLDTRMEKYDVSGCLEIKVPQIQEIWDDYDKRPKEEELWFYTCLAPQGRYPNRFIDFTLLKVRIMHWLNWRYKTPGYLHWGYNVWYSGGPERMVNPWDNTTLRSEELPVGPLKLPAGDPFIVYPGKKGICNSVRWEVMRKGIEDYEYFLMLEKLNTPEGNKLLEDIKNTVLKSHSEFTRDENELFRTKEKIAETIIGARK